MSTTFNGILSGDVFDHGEAERQRKHHARIAAAARQERAEAWLGQRLVGQTYHSFESIRYAAICAAEVAYARPLTPDENTVITNAARAIWSGLTLRARTDTKLDAFGRIERLTIRAA